jgi:SOS-response transcriptional repressor LexA
MPPPNHLLKARQDAGLTLDQASDRLARRGVVLSPGHLSRMERSIAGVTSERLIELGSLYGWSPGELLSGRGENNHVVPQAHMLPLIDSEQAAHWVDAPSFAEVVDPKRWVPAPSNVGPRAFALRLEGNSNDPDFRNGDVVVVDPDLQPKPGDWVAARFEDENTVTFRRYRLKSDGNGARTIQLVPLNPDWPTMPLVGRGAIIGVATDHMRRLV